MGYTALAVFYLKTEKDKSHKRTLKIVFEMLRPVVSFGCTADTPSLWLHIFGFNRTWMENLWKEGHILLEYVKTFMS